MRIFPAFGFSEEDQFDRVSLGIIPQNWVDKSKDPIADSSFLRFMEERGAAYDDFYWSAKSQPTKQGEPLTSELFVYVPKRIEGLREAVETKWGGVFATTA